jgi:hypothetical protein
MPAKEKQLPPILAIKVIQGKPMDSHPTFDVLMDTASSKFLRTYRFADFRQFYEEDVVPSLFVMRTAFPETYLKSTFGFRLTPEELELRRTGLDNFIQELFDRRELWPTSLKKAALAFLQIHESQLYVDAFANTQEIFSSILPTTFTATQALRFQVL